MTITRDQAIVLTSLIAIVGLAWWYLLDLAQAMTSADDMQGMVMSSAPHPFSITAAMWAVMMVGMMLPSAMPMILLFTTVQRKQGHQPVLTSGLFTGGYLLIWGSFAVAAATLQIELGRIALLSPSLTFLSARLAGLVFLMAAAYEFSPFKSRCLAQCSNPIGFITSHWRSGVVGAFRMGVSHGAFCVGCCWALMLLLFTAGVMNLLWVAALAVLALVQKALPYTRMTTTLTGTAMAVVGLVLVFR